jgi:hypothetical protein
MGQVLRAGDYELDFDSLYARMWQLASDDRGDGTRLYRPRPGKGEALKWLIAELAGTPVDPIKTMPDNDTLRRAVHRMLEEGGWADRVSQSAFRLLRDPSRLGPSSRVAMPADDAPVTDRDDEGEAVEDIPVDIVVDAAGTLQLGGFN